MNLAFSRLVGTQVPPPFVSGPSLRPPPYKISPPRQTLEITMKDIFQEGTRYHPRAKGNRHPARRDPDPKPKNWTKGK
jgi:hypothetical protein